MRGPLRREALGQALTELVHRHEALRTSFPAPRGRPHQTVAPAARLPVAAEIDVSHRADAAAEANRIVAAQAVTLFELAHGPVLRARLLRLAADEHWLVVTFHHIAIDGRSLDIFYRELGELYNAAVAGEAPRLPPVPSRYVDYARWQR